MADTQVEAKIETEEELQSQGEGSKRVKRLSMELDLAEKPEKEWRKESDTLLDVYRSEVESQAFKSNDSNMNILWSNTQTLKSAMYTKAPKPDVRRRWRSEDRVGRQIAMVLERVLSFAIDTHDFDLAIQMAVEDYLLPGRAAVRVRYTPHFDMVQTEAVIDENGVEIQAAVTEEKKVHEEVTAEYVHWDDLRISPAKSWNEVEKVFFRGKLTRKQLIEAFGKEKGEKVPLDWSPHTEEQRERDDDTSVFKRAIVWEVWDKETRTVVFFSPSYKDDILLEKEDPLGLQGFFPMPRPMYSIRTSGTMVPIPEYRLYEGQAKELEAISRRIMNLTPTLKVRGAYNATTPELGKILEMADNDLVPIQDWQSFSERGGLDGAMSFVPMDSPVAALNHLYGARDQVKATIYEITGIADIVRGHTSASETATAQRIKGQFASLRIDDRKAELSRFIRDLYRMMAEIIAEQFSPEILAMITGLDVTEEMAEIMGRDASRAYRVDIETVDTVADEARDRDAATNLLKGVVDYFSGIGPMVQAGAVTVEVAAQLLLSVLRKHRVGRDLEDAIMEIVQQEGGGQDAEMQKHQQIIQQLQQQLMQAQETLQSGQMQAQAEAQAKAQQEIAEKQAELQAKAQEKQAELEAKMIMEDRRLAQEREIKDAQMALDWQKFEAELNLKREAQGLEREKAEFDAELRVSGEQRAAMEMELRQMAPAVEPVPAPAPAEKKSEPVVVNLSVGGGKKKVNVIRDNQGKITGAESYEENESDEKELFEPREQGEEQQAIPEQNGQDDAQVAGQGL